MEPTEREQAQDSVKSITVFPLRADDDRKDKDEEHTAGKSAFHQHFLSRDGIRVKLLDLTGLYIGSDLAGKWHRVEEVLDEVEAVV